MQERFTLQLGKSQDVLKEYPDNHFDSVVCDPPYELGFMGKKWDNTGIANDPKFWAEVLRVLKPGGHLLAFSGSRTYHRMAVGIEDAGFEIRDQIMWIYGSGFPKSHNLDGEWQGWGSALKPAHEPICMARKPLTGTIAENVMQYGTGAINIGACRVLSDDSHANSRDNKVCTCFLPKAFQTDHSAGRNNQALSVPSPSDQNALQSNAGACANGRQSPEGFLYDYRPLSHSSDELAHENLIPSQECFQQQSCEHKLPYHCAICGGIRECLSKSCDTIPNINSVSQGRWPSNVIHDGSDEVTAGFPQDMCDSAARFFYCAKASKKDRDEGLGGFDLQAAGGMSGRQDGSMGSITMSRNTHPTVKPTDLMRYLCRLVTPPGGLVLDPFMGSGSTGKAAMLEGFRFVGIDMTPEYLDIARARIQHAHNQKHDVVNLIKNESKNSEQQSLFDNF